MVGKDLSKYKTSIQKIGKEQETEEVILFFSFDVVNSSLYKTINYYGWSLVLSRLFEKVQQIVRDKIRNVELWRALGDEMIFIVRISEKEEIHKYVNTVFEILIEIIDGLKSGELFKSISAFTEKEINLMILQNILSLKGAAWIAVVNSGKITDNDVEYENISAQYETANKYIITEFLGNDIDAGFRISKETCDRRLVISFELAHLLSERTENVSKLFIITYKKLKGIWKEKLYPIIWYYDKGICNNVEFDESFYYDETEECSLSNEYFLNRDVNKENENIKKKYMFTDIVKAFDKIIKDRDLQRKIEKIESVIAKTKSEPSPYTKIHQLEFQCVAICYNENNNKILIAKRKETKEKYAGKWEFGSVEANFNEKITQTIIDGYSRNFNIKVEPIIDEKREDKQPIPLSIYEIEKGRELHKGVIILARLINENGKFISQNTNYSEIRWIGEDEISQYRKEDGVPDFLSTLTLVFNKINKDK